MIPFENSELHIHMKNLNEVEKIKIFYSLTEEAYKIKPNSKFWQEAYEFIKAKHKGEAKE